MKILAIDSSAQVASVAVLTETTVLAEYSVDYKKTHSQTLLPMIDEVLRMTETAKEDIDAIAVAAGPGSFTGLRIGAATVKGLAMVWNVPVIPVSTVAGLACNLAGTDGLVCPLMDARRGQVYTGVYGFEGSTAVEYVNDACMTIEPLIAKINELGRKVTFVGDALTVFKEKLKSSVTVPYSFAPIHLAKQSAASVGWLGLKLLAEGKTVTAEEFVPTYLRISQAEREREERLEGK
ncbi:MAG: tRNA (adenosine(37)-N6)-threonylcarbamoyltransferase complex dimerization subunit type 1 TsaB [Lachnospiraceae bacterium]|nr:tRNA (adenosine(37)-N6)-threonylcarbamoyltransferase complex dimerization subunit type 1 TsaB [Lachnospiraceae bacterium]